MRKILITGILIGLLVNCHLLANFPVHMGVVASQTNQADNPYNSPSELLLHCDGADGSTIFIDSSTVSTTKNITAHGNAQIDTVQKKFGTGSLITDGAGDYLSCSGGSAYAMGTGDYTVDFWLYFSVNPTATDALYATTTSSGISCTFNTSQISIGRSLVASDFSVNHSMSTGNWYHIAIVRISGTVNIYQNGTSLGSTTLTTNYPSSGNLLVGIDGNGSSLPSNVQIDEFRVVKGTGVFTSNFTPPTTKYTE